MSQSPQQSAHRDVEDLALASANDATGTAPGNRHGLEVAALVHVFQLCHALLQTPAGIWSYHT